MTGIARRETIDSVMAMLSQSCRREVETALDRDAEPSIECKQDIQNALSGFSQARRRRRLREVVQGLINRARKPECEKCLSRKQLQVELVIPIEVLGDRG